MLDASLTLDRLIIIILLIFIWHIHEIEDCTDICTAFFSLKKKGKKVNLRELMNCRWK